MSNEKMEGDVFSNNIYEYIKSSIDSEKYSVCFIKFRDIKIRDDFDITMCTIPTSKLYNRYEKGYSIERIYKRVDEFIRPYIKRSVINMRNSNSYNEFYKDMIGKINSLLSKYNLDVSNVFITKGNISFYKIIGVSRYGFDINIDSAYLSRLDKNYIDSMYRDIEDKIIEMSDLDKRDSNKFV